MIKRVLNFARFLFNVNKVLKLMKGLDGTATFLATDEIEATNDTYGDKTAFLFEGESLSYNAFEARANQVAHWALSQGFQKGDSVALVMENSPDYPAIWFGLSKIGVATALINSNLEGTGLAHCINVVENKAVIAKGVQAERVADIASDLGAGPRLWDLDAKHGEDLEAAIQAQPTERPDKSYRQGMRGSDTCLYIYTSGTTGLPKAAPINHSRLRRTLRLASAMVQLKPEDIVYNALPLYHLTGGGLGLGTTLYGGATSYIRTKFSASQFWDDVAESNATLFVYIGEFCRYLLNSAAHPKERAHKLRAGFGNGLRGDVWDGFVKRFGVSSMREFYGSTEGNVTFINMDGTPGSVGQQPKMFDKKLGTAFVKFDVETEQPLRDAKGFCQKCDVDEVGEVLGRISDIGHEAFEGYHDKKATQKKILTDVFEKGDKWFRTGDLMRRDALGYVYFVDRIGDTFRWKGENVATNEVCDVLSKFDGISMANVYGVEVPHADGRAGMAAITTGGADIDWHALAQFLMSNLPAYAVPIFLRVQPEVETTGTFKFRKVDAVKEGFDQAQIDDPIFVLDTKGQTYIPLTV